MKTVYCNLVVVVLALVVLAGNVLAVGAEPTPVTVNGKAVYLVTEGNVGPNGNVAWQFKSGASYVLANDIRGSIFIKDGTAVSLDLSGKKVQGEWEKGGYFDCSVISDEEECALVGCPTFYSCTGGSSTISCEGTSEFYCNTQPEYPLPGCTWNPGTQQCEGAGVDCDYWEDYSCEEIGCSSGEYAFCFGIIYADFSITILNSKKITVSNGRVQGFGVGVRLVNSDVTMSRVTSIGAESGIVVNGGEVELDDCVFGATKGVSSAVFSSVGAGQGAFVKDSVFVGGKVATNSKDNWFLDCQCEFADGAAYTEYRNGVEVNASGSNTRATTTTTTLPADFDTAKFVAYLKASGAKMYGTTWCSYCRKQREEFGTNWDAALEFDCTMVEGDDAGNAAKNAEMTRLGITGFPTWVIGGVGFPGYKPLAQLVALSGYQQ